MQFILKHERRHGLRFAALDSPVGREIRQRHPAMANVDSMIWVEQPGRAGEQVLIRSAAALRIARYMGGAWRLAALGRILPESLRDAVYDLVARHRRHLAGGAAHCYVPPPSVRSRFLDLAS